MQDPGKPFSIYEVAECVGFAHQKALTPSNIINAFKKCGIYPFGDNVFTDIDFLPSAVTDRVFTEETDNNGTQLGLPKNSSSALDILSTNKDAEKNTEGGNNSNSIFKSPEEFRGFPKAKAHSEEELVLNSSSSDEEFLVKVDSEKFQYLHRNPQAHDFVFVEFVVEGDKEKIYYVGKILKKVGSSDEYQITFLRNQKKGTNKFIFPDVIDESIVPVTDVKLILPSPILCGHTSRQKASFTFEVDFSRFLTLNIR
ncbi:hypothetical protein RN001_014129 [Aquatica leii]|uniref:Uncharacterized protein n=1 Tax=Aquatica leii TaxID=1421715 RepID=A0AAN7SEC8_9COLE|nr:hypothetical protein RN001_014129 [Aquatica leii]